ncbi:TetR/AcrR family transcriptional regulator [Mycolicibacterium neworleansense]|uniref:TetR family transcriptional regulator n=1 Tax=Mycolicibacterium neworleansense TaxID=146018 RepID=A0A0H5RU11_9MYCO|nr:TetR/AcrR family transcriptional regulator [Mycolicibacterium neworleansense]MCV7359989.1 TetR/AcrR family transcriptional regulator [Mycolicibacterium neworleansense]CRZ17408.1 TetR family transcriptional regulator [Mycolicibacterium neworleansense]
MPRPRVYDPDAVLDAAESLAVCSGPASVTIRALSDAVGLSNGALYHSFGSRAGLLGQAWLRAGRRFLALQREQVAAARQGVDAIAAAAYAPVIFAERHPSSARLLLQIRRDQVLGEDLPAELAEQTRDLEKQLVDLMIELATAAWDRRDRAAVDAVTTCIVDLPTAILLRRNRLDDPTARHHLGAAVAAVLAVGPAPNPSEKGTS